MPNSNPPPRHLCLLLAPWLAHQVTLLPLAVSIALKECLDPRYPLPISEMASHRAKLKDLDCLGSQLQYQGLVIHPRRTKVMPSPQVYSARQMQLPSQLPRHLTLRLLKDQVCSEVMARLQVVWQATRMGLSLANLLNLLDRYSATHQLAPSLHSTSDQQGLRIKQLLGLYSKAPLTIFLLLPTD